MRLGIQRLPAKGKGRQIYLLPRRQAALRGQRAHGSHKCNLPIRAKQPRRLSLPPGNGQRAINRQMGIALRVKRAVKLHIQPCMTAQGHTCGFAYGQQVRHIQAECPLLGAGGLHRSGQGGNRMFKLEDHRNTRRAGFGCSIQR